MRRNQIESTMKKKNSMDLEKERKENKLFIILIVLFIFTYLIGVMYDKHPDSVGMLILFSITMFPLAIIILIPFNLIARWYELDGVLYWIIFIFICFALITFNLSFFK